ncbi:MAG: hypothetical protein RLY30_17 [Pseudomonadota bacterium]|jgi:lipopolysaccharide transport system permease protein
MAISYQWVYLLKQWTAREFKGRYRETVLGLLWPWVFPVLQILVFSWVFHELLSLRWPARVQEPTIVDYGLNAFAGLSVFGLFSEVMARAPAVVWSQPNLVTKVRFPLLVLPTATALLALLPLLIGVALLSLAAVMLNTLSAQQLPLLILGLVVLAGYALALSWILAAVAVYLRDIAQAMPALISLLMFLSPVFFPAALFPAALEPFALANPIGWGAELLRAALLNGPAPPVQWLLVHGLAAAAMLAVAHKLFHWLSSGFADVL